MADVRTISLSDCFVCEPRRSGWGSRMAMPDQVFYAGPTEEDRAAARAAAVAVATPATGYGVTIEYIVMPLDEYLGDMRDEAASRGTNDDL